MLNSRRGFTLAEMIIVVLILGILATVAAPHIINSTEDALIQATLYDVDAFFDAAELYKAEHGRYPSDTSTFNAPGDFDGYLPVRFFKKKPPIGGDSYGWVAAQSGTDGSGEGIATVFASSTAISQELALAVDEIYDDGNLNSGAAQLMSNGTIFAIAIDYTTP